jgi:hypothetical protein
MTGNMRASMRAGVRSNLGFFSSPTKPGFAPTRGLPEDAELEFLWRAPLLVP